MTPRDLQAVLAWTSVPHVGDRAFQALLDVVRESRTSLADLWHALPDDVRALCRLDPRALAAWTARNDALWLQAADDGRALADWGVDVLLGDAPDYPEALAGRRRDWPLLFAYGALGVLEGPLVALVSSRTVTPSGLLATDTLADALARRDVGLVSSTNREAYQAAATAAKRHAGPSVLVLDRGVYTSFRDGLEREPVATARVWDAAFDPDLQLLLSPFPWRQPWHRRSGPRRDALILALARAVVAVDVRAGGTMDEQCRAAAARGTPVFALDRGEQTPDGTRLLWESGGALRLAWRGSEDACGRLLSVLPPATGGPSPAEVRLREIGRFLGRLGRSVAGQGTVEFAGEAGPVRVGAAPWLREGDRTAGAACLLADLSRAPEPARLRRLLERVARGGRLAALVPARWLGPGGEGPRQEWLGLAAPRLVARLPGGPSAPGREPGEEQALLLLERDAAATAPARAFAPRRETMGRFHLRRYLDEVLAGFGSP